MFKVSQFDLYGNDLRRRPERSLFSVIHTLAQPWLHCIRVCLHGWQSAVQRWCLFLTPGHEALSFSTCYLGVLLQEWVSIHTMRNPSSSMEQSALTFSQVREKPCKNLPAPAIPDLTICSSGWCDYHIMIDSIRPLWTPDVMRLLTGDSYLLP